MDNRERYKAQFLEDGYVAIGGFMSRDAMSAIDAKIKDLVDTRVSSMPPEHVFYEDKADASTLKQLQHLDQHDAFFEALFNQPEVAGLAAWLLGSAVVAKNMQWFNKPPRIGKETPPHQDGFYFMLEPNEAVTMWLAIDEVDEENGCVRYIPGSHREGMRPHGSTGVLGFSQGIVDYSAADLRREVPMIVQPGDLIVHHSMTIHRADPNTSNRTRKGLGFIFYSSAASEDKQRHAQYQERLRLELLRQKKI